jgi:hypothetical protein
MAKRALTIQEQQVAFIEECAKSYQSINLKRLDKANITADYVLNTICESIEACRLEGDSNGVYKGCELLGKHLKLFADRVELSGKDGGPMIIKVDLKDDE